MMSKEKTDMMNKEKTRDLICETKGKLKLPNEKLFE